MTEAWFPGGPTDPDLALVQVQIVHANYWDVKESKLVQLYEMAKAVVTGKPPTDWASTAKSACAESRRSSRRRSLRRRTAPDAGLFRRSSRTVAVSLAFTAAKPNAMRQESSTLHFSAAFRSRRPAAPSSGKSCLPSPGIRAATGPSSAGVPWDATRPADFDPAPPSQPFREPFNGVAIREVPSRTSSATSSHLARTATGDTLRLPAPPTP